MSQTHTERIIGDPKNITRRDTIAGVVAVAITAVLGTAIGGAAFSTAGKVKDYIQKRTKALYANDAARSIRVSHKNQEVLDLYKEYLSPGDVVPAKTELSHRLLHTSYGKKIPAQIQHLNEVTLEETVEETAAFMASSNKEGE